VQIVPPNEVVVVVGFEVKLANRAGTMNLCIPYNVIEPIMEDLAAQNWFNVAKSNRTRDIQDKLAGNLSHAALTVTGVLAETTITLEDLMQLSVGDLVVTEKPAASPVTLCVEGRRSFHARIGKHKGMRALKIEGGVSSTDSNSTN
jgi:flagellar motor switch protein FliM